eukprot:TRINITY_DN8185_c0_g1_i3.p1 TRINITY_DN8185_c0_g1~~TRINITY_DN8185_c0_g1_i3.p1  ORF type:complete len:220 (+),score=43.02 TRINITY_DN8185_c0_g1_i3:504-1163(+)
MIGEVLKVNSSLTELNLGSNKIGPEAGMMIGEALKVDSSLIKLNLEYNEIGTEGKIKKEDRSHVISALRHKLEVSDTEELEHGFHRGQWNGDITQALIKLGVKEDWMLKKNILCLQQSASGDFSYQNHHNDLAFLKCISLLGQWNDDVMKVVVRVVERYGDPQYYEEYQVLFKGLKLIETMADKNDETADHLLVELLKHKGEEIRVAVGQTIGSRQIHQ